MPPGCRPACLGIVAQFAESVKVDAAALRSSPDNDAVWRHCLGSLRSAHPQTMTPFGVIVWARCARNCARLRLADLARCARNRLACGSPVRRVAPHSGGPSGGLCPPLRSALPSGHPRYGPRPPCPLRAGPSGPPGLRAGGAFVVLARPSAPPGAPGPGLRPPACGLRPPAPSLRAAAPVARGLGGGPAPAVARLRPGRPPCSVGLPSAAPGPRSRSTAAPLLRFSGSAAPHSGGSRPSAPAPRRGVLAAGPPAPRLRAPRCAGPPAWAPGRPPALRASGPPPRVASSGGVAAPPALRRLRVRSAALRPSLLRSRARAARLRRAFLGRVAPARWPPLAACWPSGPFAVRVAYVKIGVYTATGDRVGCCGQVPIPSLFSGSSGVCSVASCSPRAAS